jgi:hypothetical protein
MAALQMHCFGNINKGKTPCNGAAEMSPLYWSHYVYTNDKFMNEDYVAIFKSRLLHPPPLS